MAGVGFIAQTGEIATGTAKQTVLQITSPAAQRVLVSEISVSFKGIVNTDAPILVQVERQSTSAGGGSSLTPAKRRKTDTLAIVTTAKKNMTATTQPTADDEVLGEEVHPQGGFLWQARSREEMIEVEAGEKLGIAVTSAVSVSCKARIVGEE